MRLIVDRTAAKADVGRYGLVIVGSMAGTATVLVMLVLE
jgi:hypothetical protein